METVKNARKKVGSSGAATEPDTPARPRRRMNPVDREEIILREATIYFAENGPSAGTIELARRLGITQPLLYKYFPTKEALFERVYERLILRGWNPDWVLLLDDEAIPLRERLHRFYTDYMSSILTYEHVRLFLFSGLSRNDFNAQYYSVLTKRIFERIARAIRRDYGSSRSSHAVTKAEVEQVQSLHAAIYQLAFRRWVHAESFGDDLSDLVGRKVDLFLDGVQHTVKQPAPGKGRRGSPGSR